MNIPVRGRCTVGARRREPVRSVTLALGVAVTAAIASTASGCLERSVSFADTGGAGGQGSTTHAASTSGSPSGPGVTTTGSGVDMTSAVTLTQDELPPDLNPCGFQTCPMQPGMIFIEIASLGNSCADPKGPTSTNSDFWRRGVGLPVQYQTPGTYSLADPAIYVEGGEGDFASSSSKAASSGGGPGVGEGTIEVTSIDATSVTVKFTNSALNNPDEDGTFVAPRCSSP